MSESQPSRTGNLKPDEKSATNFIFLWIKIAISLTVLVLIWKNFANIKPEELFLIPKNHLNAAALGALIAQMLLIAVSWQQILRHLNIHIGWLRLSRIVLISLFFNQFVISAIGGIGARIYLAIKSGVSSENAITSVFIERFIFLSSLFLLFLLFLPSLTKRIGLGDFTLQHGIAVTTCIGIGFIGIWYGSKILSPWAKYQAIAKIINIIVLSRNTITQPKILAGPILTMLVFHLLSILAVFFIANSLNTTINFINLVTVMPLVLLISALPISVNGWGVREAAMVGILPLIGIPADQAILISITFGLGLLITRLPFGILWLGKWKKTVPQIRS